MRQNQNWIYTRDGEHWLVLDSGMLKLEEVLPTKPPTRWERFVQWLRRLRSR
jgi:hypothetical protein